MEDLQKRLENQEERINELNVEVIKLNIKIEQVLHQLTRTVDTINLLVTKLESRG